MSDTRNLRLRIAEELDRQASDTIGLGGLTVGLAINREINNAIRHYESTRFRWNETREDEFTTTVSGTRVYSLPPTLVRLDTLKLVYNGSYIPIIIRAWDEIEDRDRDVTGSNGVPHEGAIYGNILRLLPIPNGAYTLVASYIHRVRPTSLTGSYCGITTMGGASLTTTTTASHNNRLDGWTTDGEELIRARAAAAFEINYLKDENAKIEMGLLGRAGEPFLSVREKQSFERLVDEAQDASATGKTRPYEI